MEALTVKEHRNNPYTPFAKGREGMGRLTVTPELQKRIDDVHQAYSKGECVVCSSEEELKSLLDSL